jgi:tetratricopeptide (TPR) repeat protein/uncharacterized membrane protein YphA (DoxX/SURF4 family)
MDRFSPRSLAVALIRISLALYLGAAGLALLTVWTPGEPNPDPLWLPPALTGAFAPLAGTLFAICGVLLLIGLATELVSLAVTAMLLVVLGVWLVGNALHNTMNHLIPFTAAALVVFAAAPHDRLRFGRAFSRFDDVTRASLVVLAARLFLGGIFLAQGIRSVRRLGLVGFAEKVYVAPLADSWVPEPLLFVAGVTNPIIQIATGVLLLLGLFTPITAAAAGLFLVTIFFGHLLSDPFDRGDSVHAYAMANFLLSMVILWLHPRGDRFSFDALFRRRPAALAAMLVLAGCASGSPAQLAAAVDAHIDSQRYQDVPRRTAETRARAALASALRADPEHPRVVAAAAQIALVFDRDETRAAELYARAVASMPDDPGLLFDSAQVLGGLGRFPEAVAQLERAIALDSRVRRRAGRLFFMAGRYDDVLASYDPMPEAPRERALAHFYRGLTFEQRNRVTDAVAEHERAVTLFERDAGAVAALARTYARAGRREEAAQLLQELLARHTAGRHVVEYQIAAAYEALGDDQSALTWLRHAVDARDPWLMWLDVDPRWRRLRATGALAAL